MALVAGTALAAITGAGSASASPSHQLHVWKTLPGDYLAPLQFAVSGRKVAVADSAASALYLVGHTHPIAYGPAPSQDPESSGDLAGVDIRNGRIAYTTSTGDHSDTRLTVLNKHGKKVLKVSLSAYEKKRNPDKVITYGVTKPWKASTACKAELVKADVPLTYKGAVDSHPYAVKGLSDGSWLVADAGGNDILRVSKWGHVSTVAVLPAQPVKLTSDVAAQFGVQDCLGLTYRFEAVPTDVEVANGHIYVSTLPAAAVDWAACTASAGTGRRTGSRPASLRRRTSPSRRRAASTSSSSASGSHTHQPGPEGGRRAAGRRGRRVGERPPLRVHRADRRDRGSGHLPGHIVILK